jgi:predicted Zn-dependent protease with MMP-like domain
MISMPLPFSTPPSLGDLDAIARRIFDSLPADLTEKCRDLVIRIEDFPEDAVLLEMGIESPYDLAGLYQGVPLTEQQESALRSGMDVVYLYRRPLLDWWCDEGCDLEYLIRHVLVHEIGHHFGFSDADMERIEALMSDDDPGSAIH